jgi:hypothetical protein
MLPWISQAIIVVQTHFHGKIVFKESSVQYAFGQRRNPPLMRAINIPLGMLIPLDCSCTDCLLVFCQLGSWEPRGLNVVPREGDISLNVPRGDIYFFKRVKGG